MIDVIIILAILGFPFGLAVGAGLSYKYNSPDDKDLAKYMDRLVNQEELESHQRLAKYRMARNGQKSQRFDGGPNAKTFRMKVRPTTRRTKQD